MTSSPLTAPLWFVDSGEVDLPVVLCLHSLFLDHRMFDDLAEAGRGRVRVVRPDFRGQGSSPAAENIVTMEQCAEDVLDVVDSLGLTGVHLVAQSMGGDVAVRVAARRPELVGRLVLLGSSVRAEPPEQLEAFRPIADEVERSGFQDDLLEMIMQIMLGETCRNDPARAGLVSDCRAAFADLSPTLVHAIRGVVERSSAVDLLPAVTAPTLVVSGGEDVVRPPEWSREVVDGVMRGALWSLPDVGHSVILERPQPVIERVLDFVTRLD